MGFHEQRQVHKWVHALRRLAKIERHAKVFGLLCLLVVSGTSEACLRYEGSGITVWDQVLLIQLHKPHVNLLGPGCTCLDDGVHASKPVVIIRAWPHDLLEVPEDVLKEELGVGRASEGMPQKQLTIWIFRIPRATARVSSCRARPT